MYLKTFLQKTSPTTVTLYSVFESPPPRCGYKVAVKHMVNAKQKGALLSTASHDNMLPIARPFFCAAEDVVSYVALDHDDDDDRGGGGGGGSGGGGVVLKPVPTPAPQPTTRTTLPPSTHAIERGVSLSLSSISRPRFFKVHFPPLFSSPLPLEPERMRLIAAFSGSLVG